MKVERRDTIPAPATVGGPAASCASSPGRGHGAFFSRTLGMDGSVHAYSVFAPAAAAGGPRPSVILFLHGSGERGSDGDKPTLVGVGPRIRSDPDGFPAIVVFPQAPKGADWSHVTPMVLAQLEAATGEFGGDPDRTYLTGLSMGGFGVWDLAFKQPDRFAALAPICGGLKISGRTRDRSPQDKVRSYASAAELLKATPIWMFHGAKDHLVTPQGSREMKKALDAAGARDARYTEFRHVRHNSWDPAYRQTPEFWIWLFAQRRGGSGRA